MPEMKQAEPAEEKTPADRQEVYEAARYILAHRHFYAPLYRRLRRKLWAQRARDALSYLLIAFLVFLFAAFAWRCIADPGFLEEFLQYMRRVG